jgi:pSer/pThr/pTyr-binding forkhead associated (FHA) protein
MQGTIPASPAPSWANASEPTMAAGSDYDATLRSEGPVAVGQATIDRVENPGRLILRSEDGTVVKEYVLDKLDMSIGRLAGSDILLPKDKLASRRHASIHYENGNYVVRDEGSSNGTFVNGQQLEENGSQVLKDRDRLGIGEHELIFRAYGSTGADVEDLPTISVPYDAGELTYQTRVDEQATVSPGEDYGTNVMAEPPVVESPVEETTHADVTMNQPAPAESVQAPAPSSPSPAPAPTQSAPLAPPVSVSMPVAASTSIPSPLPDDTGVTFGRITTLPLPDLPDIAPLMAALSALDGQVMSLQEQLNSTQEALRNHENDLNQITAQLRSGVRRVSDRMDSTIADVARKREELSWAELLQLMEDVENNPRDIEYVTKLARKARELRKVFQMHQNVLSTMAECNSLLRSLIGEEK